MSTGKIKISEEILASLLALSVAHLPLKTIQTVDRLPSTTNLPAANLILEQEIAIGLLFSLFEELIEKDKEDAVRTIAEYFELDKASGNLWEVIENTTKK